MARGFIYVLSNDSMPGAYKIGFTTKHPYDRMDALSRSTSCPTPFNMLAFIGCEDAQLTESEVHKNLNKWRINNAREFFSAPLEVIQDQLRQYGSPNEDAFFDSPLVFEIENKKSQSLTFRIVK